MTRRRPDRGLSAWARRYPCRVPPTGWSCSRGHGHNGPCAARPRWWNLDAHVRLRSATRNDDGGWLLIIGLTVLLAAAAVAVVTAR